jgi:very-short-patch-repair endonuclease
MAIIIPYNSKLKLRARAMRNNPTDAEKKMWDVLRQGNLKSFRFHRQKPLGNYIVDFYCTALLLVIELDGSGHADEDQHEYDVERTAFLNGYGITVLRFWNDEVLSSSDGVYERVLEWIELKKLS